MKRRTFLGTGAVGTAAAALAAPAIAQDTREWSMVTAWPKNLPGPGVAAQMLADRISTLSGGRLTVRLHAAGELVPGQGVFDAVSEGMAQLYHAVPAYWGSKSKGILLFGSQPFGLEAMPGGPEGALVFAMALIFVLGFFLDFVEITVILLPLVAPVLILMGHDPVWLSILIAINLQTSFLTPPFGFSLFYLRGAAPPEVTTGQIYAGVAPFVLLQIVGIAVIWLLPGLATWLPRIAF